jgi:hypothetical protein
MGIGLGTRDAILPAYTANPLQPLLPMKTKILALLAAGLVGTSAAIAGTVQVSPGGNQSENGGPFIANTSDLGSFNAFCLELTEGLDYSLVYNYDGLVTAATEGGAGGPSPDPLSVGSVALMEQWGSQIPSLSVTDARALQLAFWMLEEELVWDVNNAFLISLGLTENDAKADAVSFGGVRVINPYLLQSVVTPALSGATVFAATLDEPRFEVVHFQSLIVYVPDSGTTLILLGLGLGLVGLVSRRARR